MFDSKSHAKFFAEKMSEILRSTFGAENLVVGEPRDLDQIPSDEKLYVSLFLTGTIYGEYILSLDEAVAKKFLSMGNLGSGDDSTQVAGQMFGELLNIVAGVLAPKVKKTTDEVTITAPRFFSGKPFFPPVKATCCSLKISETESIDCIFYVDRMLLDITSSYKDSLKRLIDSYKKLKKANEHILSQQKMLIHAEKVTSIGTLSAGVAHNINTPLGTIQLSCSNVEDAMMNDPIDKDQALETIGIINRTVTKISSIIASLRAYSEDISITEVQNISAKKFFDQVVEEFRGKRGVSEKGIDFFLNYKNISDEHFECGASELKKSIFSILENALELCEEIDNKADRWIKLDVEIKDGILQFSISNGGPSLDPISAAKVFDPFYTTKDSTHAGLGLTLARGIIEGHSGKIFMDTSLDHTHVVAQIPMVRATEETAVS